MLKLKPRMLKTRDIDTASSPLVWSLWVRVTHALVAIGVLVMWAGVYVWHETGALHRTLGYAVLACVVVRLVYGVMAQRLSAEHKNSRLVWPRVSAIHAHVAGLRSGQLPPHVGHNPLGQLAVYAMWLFIVSLALTGYISRTDALWGEEWPVQWHGYGSDILMALVVLHGLAIVWVGRISKQALIRQMVTGKWGGQVSGHVGGHVRPARRALKQKNEA